jgi:hypothetical protein
MVEPFVLYYCAVLMCILPFFFLIGIFNSFTLREPEFYGESSQVITLVCLSFMDKISPVSLILCVHSYAYEQSPSQNFPNVS